MVGEHAKALQRAIESLTKTELAALKKLASDDSPDNRAAYREIHGTLETMRSDLRRQHSVLTRILKRFGLVP